MNKLQVFISSTYTDLREERQIALQTILDAGHVPAGMELFVSDNKVMLEYIKEWIRSSDILLLVIGNRYGAVEKESGLSYTELEYRFAKEIGIPILTIVLTGNYKVSKRIKTEIAKELDKIPLENFKNEVAKYPLSFVDTKDELKYKILQGLSAKSRELPDKGWVRVGADFMLKHDFVYGKKAFTSSIRNTWNHRDYNVNVPVSNITFFIAAIKTKVLEQRFVIYCQIENSQGVRKWIGYKNFDNDGLTPSEYTINVSLDKTSDYLIVSKPMELLSMGFANYELDGLTVVTVRTRGDSEIAENIEFYFGFFDQK